MCTELELPLTDRSLAQPFACLIASGRSLVRIPWPFGIFALIIWPPECWTEVQKAGLSSQTDKENEIGNCKSSGSLIHIGHIDKSRITTLLTDINFSAYVLYRSIFSSTSALSTNCIYQQFCPDPKFSQSLIMILSPEIWIEPPGRDYPE